MVKRLLNNSKCTSRCLKFKTSAHPKLGLIRLHLHFFSVNLLIFRMFGILRNNREISENLPHNNYYSVNNFILTSVHFTFSIQTEKLTKLLFLKVFSETVSMRILQIYIKCYTSPLVRLLLDFPLLRLKFRTQCVDWFLLLG